MDKTSTKTNSEETASDIGRFSFRQDFPRIFFLALVYFLAHGISFFFPDSGKVIMLVWPAGGIGLAAFLLNRRRLWPFLTLAFFIAGITADILLAHRSLLSGVGFMTGNMVESMGCAWLILSVSGDFRNFDRIKEVVALMIGAVLINAFSSCIGAFTSVLASGVSFGDSWKSWYIADGLGILLVGTFFVSWTHKFKAFIVGLNLKKIIEGVVFMIVWLISTYIIFYQEKNKLFFGFHPYLLVALLVWPAIRFRMKGVTLVLVILFIFMLFSPAIVNGPSPWGGPDIDLVRRLLEMQLFLAFLAIVSYLMSAGYTSLKNSEGALRESEEKFRNVFENSFVGKSITSVDGQMIVNRAFSQIVGYSEDELSKIKWETITHPDSVEKDKKMVSSIISGEKESAHWEKRYIHKNGNIIWVDINIALQRDSNDKALFFITSIIDISERKRTEKALRESEEHYRNLVDELPDGVYKSTHEGKFVEVNPAMALMLGYANTEELMAIDNKNPVVF